MVLGSDVSYKVPGSKDLEEDESIDVWDRDTVRDVDGIKMSPDTHFCILTLSKSVKFGLNDYGRKIAPLCLPEINNKHYDEEFKGTVFGLGYTKGFPKEARATWKTQKKLRERELVKQELVMQSSSSCKNDFTVWYLQRKWLPENQNFEYFWLEK